MKGEYLPPRTLEEEQRISRWSTSGVIDEVREVIHGTNLFFGFTDKFDGLEISNGTDGGLIIKQTENGRFNVSGGTNLNPVLKEQIDMVLVKKVTDSIGKDQDKM